MAVSRKGYQINDYGLSNSIRKRINDLVSLQLNPTTINLFTAEFSQMDEEVRIRIGMYIAQLLEIENDLLSQHYNNLREQNFHGNSRDHLIMEQRKANLQRIQQIFIQELRKQEKIEEAKGLREAYEENAEGSLGALNFKSAMVTNGDRLTQQELQRAKQAQIANIRRNKELFDFEEAQIKKLIAKYQAENNVQRILELQQRLQVVKQEYLLRRDALLRTIDAGNGVTAVVTTKNDLKKGQKSREHKNDNTIIYDNNFFDVDTIEMQKVALNTEKKAKTKATGKNKKSDIPNEVLSDQTVELQDVVLSNDFSNPNSEDQKMAEIDKILSEVENMEISTKKAEKANDPFLMLLAREQDLKAKADDTPLIPKKKSEKTKTLEKSSSVKKPVGEDNKIKKSSSVKSQTKIDEEKKALEKDLKHFKNEIKKNEEILRRKDQQINDKNKSFQKLKQDKAALEERLKKLQQELKKDSNEVKQKEIITKEIIIRDDEKIRTIAKENKDLLRRIKELERLTLRNNKENENAKKLISISEAKQKEAEIEKRYQAQIKALEAAKAELEQKIADKKIQQDVKAASNQFVLDYENQIKELKKANQDLTLAIKNKPLTPDFDDQAQKRKAKNVVNALRDIYLKRMKGINLLHTLRVKNKLQYEYIDKDHHLEKEAAVAVNSLKLKSKAIVAKKDLELKERMVELKHHLLVQQDLKAPKVGDANINEKQTKKVVILGDSLYKKNVLDNIQSESAKKSIKEKRLLDVFDVDSDLLQLDLESIDLDTSIFHDIRTTPKPLPIPLEKHLQEEKERQHLSVLEHKARMKIITEEEQKIMHHYQQKYKKKKDLRKYRLIQTYKR